MIDLDCNSIKKEIGKRFKQFREAIGKTQAQLAEELNVYQSTVTNIEVGKTFPGVKYIHYFYETYHLNSNWLLNSSGDIFLTTEDTKSNAVSRLGCHIPKGDPKFERYLELLELMQVPVIEQLILAKLLELKVIASEEIEEYLNFVKGKKRKISTSVVGTPDS